LEHAEPPQHQVQLPLADGATRPPDALSRQRDASGLRGGERVGHEADPIRHRRHEKRIHRA
jgi:hypothetical protein